MQRNLETKLTGLTVFIVSLILYTFTLEPTTSFWDCSEFILSAAKLEVNHPAGAPLFMLFGRLFTLLSFGSPEKIAWTINFMSGLFSALTIFFLFHVITKLVKKMSDNKFAVLGSAAIGALTFAVSDSFWFSAVEGEVYGLSMFFLILSFWIALKWEEDFGLPGNEKWILFLALITGLGIGVHLLNLLVLPSVVMIFGFKKYGYSHKKLFLFFGIGAAVLLGILYILTPVVMKILAGFDFVFVNKMNLPLHSGALTGIVFILSIISLAILYFRKTAKKTAELAMLSILFILIGFSVYSVNIIRSSANPPVNFGRPNNIYSLIDYLNREQYPKRPLVFGQAYNSPITGINERSSKNFMDNKYQETKLASTYKYDKKTCTYFPRMYSPDERHIQAYKSWINIKGKRISVKQRSGESETIVVPRFTDHLNYFITYQFGYMFGRYFMWNFVGRQNDRQGRGDLMNGNWLSGIGFVDSARLGAQDKVPDWLKNNRGRNTYFFIPFLLGLLGAWQHYKRHQQSFFVVLALFIMGGLGLSIYINEIPITPRERDYVFVVAFLAFSIWIGLSFWTLLNLLNHYLNKNKFAIAVFIVLLIGGPGLMAFQNYDDHNRSNRFAARDFAENMLKSCPPNAILFTSGDNDTYPLLYCQEVEAIRTDVRIVIMPFLSANWFLDGLRQPKYNDAGLNMELPQRKYDYGKLDYTPVLDKLKRDTTWEEAFKFLQMDNESAKVRMSSGDKVNFIPLSKLNFRVKVDGETGQIPVSLKGKKMLYKHQLAFWDIISSNAGTRPICFASKAEAGKHGLGSYLQCEGFVYRLVPEKSKTGNVFSIGKCNPDLLYKKLTKEFNWGNVSDPSVYADWNTVVNLSIFQVRNVFNEVALLLLQKGEKEKAAELLELSTKSFPLTKIPHDIFSIKQVELMLKSDLGEKAVDWFEELEQDVTQTLEFYNSLNVNQQIKQKEEIERELYYLNQLVLISSKMEDKSYKKRLEQQLEMYYKMLAKA